MWAADIDRFNALDSSSGAAAEGGVRVLIGCEFSGIVRDAFRARGHDAWSCDLLPSERPGPHIQGDVLEVLGGGWDLMVAHPPCTYLSRAGARWRTPERLQLAEEAADFVRALWEAPIPRVAIENPIGMLNRLWRYPDQTIEPFHFGERFSKRTCLWLRGLPPLLATSVHSNATPWVQSNTGWRRRMGLPHYGEARNWKDRARMFPLVADAMADQWGSLAMEHVA